MKKFGTLVLLSTLLVVADCVSSKQASGPSEVLVGPYEIKLIPAKASADPGEIVMFKIQYRNIGNATLWVPTCDQICFDIFAVDRNADETVELPPSACSGLRFLAVRPGTTLTYDRGLRLPIEFGSFRVSIYGHQETATIVEIKPPNQALEPTIQGVTPRAEAKPRVAPPGIVAHLER